MDGLWKLVSSKTHKKFMEAEDRLIRSPRLMLGTPKGNFLLGCVLWVQHPHKDARDAAGGSSSPLILCTLWLCVMKFYHLYPHASYGDRFDVNLNSAAVHCSHHEVACVMVFL